MRLGELIDAAGDFFQAAVVEARHRVVEDNRCFSTTHAALCEKVRKRQNLLLPFRPDLRRPVVCHDLPALRLSATALEFESHRRSTERFAFLSEELLEALVYQVFTRQLGLFGELPQLVTRDMPRELIKASGLLGIRYIRLGC